MSSIETSIAAGALPSPPALRECFERRQPFRHFVADGFFPLGYANQLLADFPAFERGNARNEDGALGGKSTVERIRELGPAYVALDDMVRGKAFLDWLSAATGIPSLLYDPWYFGGGTHDNRHGQDLDPHVDFNRHPENGWHRRLNLIVYLNPQWEDAWGGSLELHTNPRSTDDRVTLVTPLFNRCVVFETTEWSWHGFGKIQLPEAQQALSRRSIALYFYTRERPADELAPNHSTIYVDRPLPSHFQPGHTLTDTDVQLLQSLLTRRDMHNQRLYRELQQVGATGSAAQSGHLGRLAGAINQLYRRRVVDKQPLDRASVKAAMLPFVAYLPRVLREPLRRAWRRRYRNAAPDHVSIAKHAATLENGNDRVAEAGDAAYQARIARETEIFATQVNVHDLPAIFHYWSNRYLLPLQEPFGARNPDEFFVTYLLEAARRSGNPKPRFVSLGSGNCDAELRVAQGLRERGLVDFTLECIDINPIMLERGRALAAEAGLSAYVIPVKGDFNRWKPDGQFDGVMANQSLHHVEALESLFDATYQAMTPQALFAISDTIGRNGHRRWPEAMRIVREFWKELPKHYRYNLQLNRYESSFEDWDCSSESFEGIRAQDILPLLIDRFGFEVFVGYGNLIDPFTDRSFGPHFDADAVWDRGFIDRVHARDEAEMQAGRITPTHMLAVVTRDKQAVCRHRLNLSPAFCVRAT